MEYRLTLDGQNFTPIEWRDGSFSAGWDDDVFYATGGASLNFSGEAYEYIYGVYTAGYCNTIECKVYYCDELLHTGLIFVSEAVFDLVKCLVNVAVSDDGYIARVKNKSDQKYYLDVGTSSDGTSITAASATNIAPHTVTTGASLANRECYKIDEALGFLIRAMSNDTMAYTSDFFGTGGDGNGYVLVTGLELRNPGGNIGPYVSFKELFGDLRRLFNLRAAVEDDQGTLTLRIEPYVYWRSEDLAAEFINLTTLTERVDAEQIYSTIEAGSSFYRQDTDDTPNTSYTNNLIITWDKITYNIRGECVTDNTLDLVTKDFLIDSNSIENALNGNEVNDRNNFIIETDGTDSLQFGSLGDGNYYYNQSINNITVINRWGDRIHNDTFAESGGTSANFEASNSIETTDVDPDYDDEISDPGSNYDPTTTPGLYNIPLDGLYLFEAYFDIEVEFIEPSFSAIEFVSNLWRTDGVTAEIAGTASRIIPNPIAGLGSGTAIVALTFSFFYAVQAAAGDDYFLLNATPGPGISDLNITFNVGCLFKGGTAIVSSSSVPIIQESSTPITVSEYTEIVTNPQESVSLNQNKGHITNVTFTPFGISEIKTEFKRQRS